MTDAENVTTTWAIVLEMGLGEVGDLFYATLFEMTPAARDLFAGTNIKAQARRLMGMIDSAIKLLGKPEELLPVLEELGARHSSYGTKDVHYDLVGAALIETLRKGLGEKFTAEVEASWKTIYGVIADNMIKGQNSPRGQDLLVQYEAKLAAKAEKAAAKAKAAEASA